MEQAIHPKSIVILDFGGQYAHLIARRVRECGAFSEICPPNVSVDILRSAAGIVLSGGPQSVYDAGSPQADHRIFELDIPVLGICYGHQWIGHALGGKVTSGHTKEYGPAEITVAEGGGYLLKGLPERFTVWMSHGDEVSELPPGFHRIASSDGCLNTAMAHESKHIFGVQFHLEVTHTQNGGEILKRFVELCDHAPWSVEGFAKRIGKEVLKTVGDRKVFMLVSGGVDSTVAFTLLNEALGVNRVQGLLVDTGLMRKDEVRQIQQAFATLGITNLRVEDASQEFFAALDGVVDPEKKRTVIGNTFLAVQKRVSEDMKLRVEDGWMLGQGTIYPDTIETGGTKHADTIKTHHNRVPMVQEMMERGLVIEPLAELYKDEVRRLGEEIGLPHELVWRHPFPGPGLGVRILCAEGPASVRLPEAQSVDAPHMVLPVRSVGVQGDGRTYRHALSLFAAGDEPPAAYWSLATRIPNTMPTFSRVLFCTSHDEPFETVFSPGGITRERADLLREADSIVDTAMRQAGLYEAIWQFPVVLLPFGERKGGYSIVLRPIASAEAMTANAVRLAGDVLGRMTENVLTLPDIDAVFLDMTDKPPATIEWE